LSLYLDHNATEPLDPEARKAMEDALEGEFVVLRKGKKNYRLVRVRG